MRPFGVIALLVLPAVFGCSNSEPPPVPRKFVAPPEPIKRTALQAKSLDGVITGKVVYDGEPPVPEFIERIKDNEDRAACLKAPPVHNQKQTWMVDRESKAVANIVVWVEPPAGTLPVWSRVNDSLSEVAYLKRALVAVRS